MGSVVLAAYHMFDLGFQPDGSGWSFSRLFEMWKNATSRNESQSTHANVQCLDKEDNGIHIGWSLV